MCVVFYISEAFTALHSHPASDTDPHTEQNSKEIPLSCCFTRWTSVIVAEFPPRHWSLTHTHIHQQCQCNTNGTKNSGIPFFVVMTLFTRWRLGYKNEKCRSITFGALSTCCSNIYETTLWILFLYDSKFLLMSDRLACADTHRLYSTRARRDRRDFFTSTCINRNNSQGSYITHHSNGLLYIFCLVFLH